MSDLLDVQMPLVPTWLVDLCFYNLCSLRLRLRPTAEQTTQQNIPAMLDILGLKSQSPILDMLMC